MNDMPPDPARIEGCRNTRRRMLSVIWTVQGAGLVLITFASFFRGLWHLQDHVFVALLAVAVVASWTEGRNIWVRTPLDLPLMLFVGWVLVTVPFAFDVKYTFGAWVKLFGQVLMFYWALLVCDAQRGTNLLRQVLAAVTAGGAALALYGLMDFLAHGGTWKDRSVRAVALSADSVWLSTYMILSTPVIIAAGVCFRDHWKRVAAGIVVTASVLAQAASYARSGWLAVVIEILAYGVLAKSRRVILLVLGATAFMAVLLLMAPQAEYHKNTLDQTTLVYRFEGWKAGKEVLQQHPIVGVGYGVWTFAKVFEDRIFSDRSDRLDVTHSHSHYLMVAMGSGIPALALFLWVLCRAVGTLVIAARQASRHGRSGVALAVAVALVGFSVQESFETNFTMGIGTLVWILVATGIAWDGENAGREPRESITDEFSPS